MTLHSRLEFDRDETQPKHDPLRYELPLSLGATLFPAGYPATIGTNSPPVLGTAAALWSRFPQLGHVPSVSLRVAVEDRIESVPDRPGLPRGQWHLFSINHGEQNFAFADLSRGLAFASITQNVATNESYLKHYFLEPLVYTMLAARHFTLVHAAGVSLNGRTILFCGDSGAGKTCLAYACARRGWTFLSGDGMQIVRSSQDYAVTGRPYGIRFRPAALRLFPELAWHTATIGPAGKLDLEIDTHDLPIDIGVEGKASHIVFLDRRPTLAGPQLKPLDRSKARRYMEEAICVGDTQIREAQTRALDHFLCLPTWTLRYSDLDSAELRLRKLVTEDAE
jgi:hypothetical protein